MFIRFLEEIFCVVFTTHPITKNANRIIIEADCGIGKSVVGGKIKPDSCIANKKQFFLNKIFLNNQL